MSYWLFVVTSQKADGQVFEADEILRQRLSDQFWGLGEKTPNRRALRQGDQVVFYVGKPYMAFSATAILASDSFALTPDQKREYSHGKAMYTTDYGVRLANVSELDSPKLVKDLAPSLSFIENTLNWGAYFQGGVRQLSEDDFRVIVEGFNYPIAEVVKPQEAIVSESQFALESHLEEFIERNWKHINFGANLELYVSDDQNGRQFPAGSWSIDFLCVDRANGDFVVIELKRGRSSDTTVGQVLRYIGWVDENLAKPGQRTRGIIIAQDVDQGLKYAVKGLPHVAVLTYKVDFQLFPFQR